MLRSLPALAVLLFAGAAAAAEVSLPYGGRSLIGELTLAPGKQAKDGAIVIVHDEMQAASSPLPQALARDLAARGRSVLAVTLSLGQDGRRAPLPCDALHSHKHTDAAGEVKAWLDWLQQQGADDATLVGLGRGGNQVAQYLTGGRDMLVSHVVLVSPTTWTAGRTAEDYKTRFGDDLGRRFREAREKVKAGEGGAKLENVGFLGCPKATVTAEAFADYYQPSSSFDTPELVKRIKQLTLVIATPDAPADLTEKMRGVRGESLLFEQAPADRLPEVIDRFLVK